MRALLAKIYRSLGLSKNFQLFLMRVFQDQFLIGVTGIIFNDKNQILLFKHSYRQHQWSLPGGYLKSKEHPKEGLEREIEEESGLIVSADNRMLIRTDRDSARLDICFTGVFIGGEFKKSHEVTQAGFYAYEEMPLLRRDQILLINRALQLRKPFPVQPAVKTAGGHKLNSLFNKILGRN